MNRKPPWENKSGIQILRLYSTEDHPNWQEDVNKSDLHPGWPRIVLLDLSAEEFEEFQKDPFAFDQKYGLFPEQPMRWMSHCAKPPVGEGIPKPDKRARWILVVNHSKPSVVSCCACPQDPEQ
jgi:hypothetical protein